MNGDMRRDKLARAARKDAAQKKKLLERIALKQPTRAERERFRSIEDAERRTEKILKSMETRKRKTARRLLSDPIEVRQEERDGQTYKVTVLKPGRRPTTR